MATALRALGAALAVLAGALLVFLTVPGCAQVAESHVAETLNGLLPQYLGPADRYDTRVRAASTGAVLRGRLENVHVDGESVHLPGGPVLERLTLDLDDVAADPKEKRLASIGAAHFTARVAEAELNRFLTARHLDEKGLLGVTLGAGKATLEARPALLARFGITGLTVPVAIEGRLVPADGSRLDFVPDAARVLEFPVPHPVLGLISRELNPVVDLSEAPLPLQIREASIQKGCVTLSGDVPPEAILRASAAPASSR